MKKPAPKGKKPAGGKNSTGAGKTDWKSKLGLNNEEESMDFDDMDDLEVEEDELDSDLYDEEDEEDGGRDYY